MQKECEKFIKLVREHPCIYDVTSTMGEHCTNHGKKRHQWDVLKHVYFDLSREHVPFHFQ